MKARSIVRLSQDAAARFPEIGTTRGVVVGTSIIDGWIIVSWVLAPATRRHPDTDLEAVEP